MTKSKWTFVRILGDQFLPSPDRWGLSVLVRDGDCRYFEVTTTIEMTEDATMESIAAELTRRLSLDLIDQARIIPA